MAACSFPNQTHVTLCVPFTPLGPCLDLWSLDGDSADTVHHWVPEALGLWDFADP